jgi:8-hydroxy-5-deazaflavin:NADPH oxidoreductase
MTEDHTILTIAVLGGTGKEGSGLAMRWALNGYKVIIGSRDAERAKQRVVELNTQLGGDYLTGMENAEAAKASNLVVLSVPYSAHKATLESVKDHLAGKILVDLTVALQPPKVRTVHLPEGKASALEAQAIVGDEVKVVAAFQTISADHLGDPHHIVDSDVLVCGGDAEAKANVMKLVEAIGCRGVDAGPLANAIAVEAMTPVLLYINKAYGIKGAGIRITGI